MNELLTVSSSPHIRHVDTTAGIMADVIIALCPAAIFGCIMFGWRAALVLAVSIISCVAAEYVWNKLLKKPVSVGDLSAVVTGLLLGLNLPSTLPPWMAAIGGIVAIIVVKQMFGGIGCNFANPAIAARIVLMVSFPAAMTKFAEPVSAIESSATPLAEAAGKTSIYDLFFGLHSGCIGEISAFLLLVGGVYLVLRRVITPTVPLCFIGTVFLLTLISGDNPISAILKGGLMIGAIFMATDYTTSPSSPVGKVIFGVGCGVITFAIRRFGSLPEGVSYSILLMNVLVPHINRIMPLKPFGKEAVPDGK